MLGANGPMTLTIGRHLKVSSKVIHLKIVRNGQTVLDTAILTMERPYETVGWESNGPQTFDAG